jgi:glucokinase
MARADVLAAVAGKATAAEVFQGVQAGDQACVSAVESAAEYLGIALANVFTVVGPDRIVIGGGVAEAGDVFLDPIRAATRRRATLLPPEAIRIVPAELGSVAGAVGAALAANDDATSQ